MNDFDFLTGTWDIANRWHTSFLDRQHVRRVPW